MRKLRIAILAGLSAWAFVISYAEAELVKGTLVMECPEHYLLGISVDFSEGKMIPGLYDSEDTSYDLFLYLGGDPPSFDVYAPKGVILITPWDRLRDIELSDIVKAPKDGYEKIVPLLPFEKKPIYVLITQEGYYVKLQLDYEFRYPEPALFKIHYVMQTDGSRNLDETTGVKETTWGEVKLRTSEVSLMSATGTKKVLVIFGKLKGDPDPFDPETDYENYDGESETIHHFLLPNYRGSLNHFYNDMSNGKLLLESKQEGYVDIPIWYESDSSDPADYPGPWGVLKFNDEVIQNVIDNPPLGFSFADYDGDGDGYVDLVVFIYDRTRLTHFADGTIDNYPEFDTGDGVKIKDRAIAKGTVGWELEVGLSAHEIGHILGLPDLYDLDHFLGESDPEKHSAGLGLWVLMAYGQLGWADADWWTGRKWNNGPNPFSVWSKIKLGWLNPIKLTTTSFDVALGDIHSGGPVYKVVPRPSVPEEYFLVCNRQKEGSYYTRNDPSEGLIMYHVDDRIRYSTGNKYERHKLVDLECPDGLFSDRGYPGEEPNPVSGGDNLDFWANDQDYRQAHNGNRGDATDVFDGATYVSFTPYTNPNTNAYNGPNPSTDTLQNVPTHFAVVNIHKDPNDPSVMRADFIFNYWSGEIAENTTWSNDPYGNPVYVGGDVIVPEGVTLTIQPGTKVVFATSDASSGGWDSDRCELIVQGKLLAEGTSSDPITFQSVNGGTAKDEWYGIVFSSTADDASVVKYANIKNARYGIYCDDASPAIEYKP